VLAAANNNQFRVEVQTDVKPNTLSGVASIVDIGILFKGETITFGIDFLNTAQSRGLINGKPFSGDLVTSQGIIIKRRNSGRFSIHEYEVIIPDVLQLLIQAYPLTMVSHVSLRVHSSKFAGALTGLCGNMNGDSSDDLSFINSASIATSLVFQGPIIPFRDAGVLLACDISRLSPALQASATNFCASVDAPYQQACIDDVCQTADIHAAEFPILASFDRCLENVALTFDTAVNCPPLCPGLCSLRGSCVNRVCQCPPGALGADCSQNELDRCFVASFVSEAAASPNIVAVSLTPITSSLSVEQFYNYNSIYHSSATGLESTFASTAFLYTSLPRNRAPTSQPASPQTSFIVVHDKPQSGEVGAASLQFQATHTGNNSALTVLSIAVKDDVVDSYSDNLATLVSEIFFFFFVEKN
jgi:hypothetical protein